MRPACGCRMRGEIMLLDEIRKKIGDIDSEMAELFERRMDAVREVAEYKRERGLAIEDLEREQELINSKSTLVHDDAVRPYYVSFLQNTMDLSKQFQYRLISGIKAACADDKYMAGYHAAAAIFGDRNVQIFPDCEAAYRAVANGECNLAVLPLENSYKGEIGKVYDLIFSGNLYVNEIYAAEYNGSTTRYAVLSKSGSEPAESGEKNEAILIMFTVRDEVGGLAKAINLISAYGFNMRVLRSRPQKDLPWHYYFYAELEGDCSMQSIERISRALRASCPVFKVAGRFTENRTVPVSDIVY